MVLDAGLLFLGHLTEDGPTSWIVWCLIWGTSGINRNCKFWESSAIFKVSLVELDESLLEVVLFDDMVADPEHPIMLRFVCVCPCEQLVSPGILGELSMPIGRPLDDMEDLFPCWLVPGFEPTAEKGDVALDDGQHWFRSAWGAGRHDVPGHKVLTAEQHQCSFQKVLALVGVMKIYCWSWNEWDRNEQLLCHG